MIDSKSFAIFNPNSFASNLSPALYKIVTYSCKVPSPNAGILFEPTVYSFPPCLGSP